MTARTNRIPVWLVLILVAAGVLLAVALGVFNYANAVPRLHPDPQAVSSVAGIASPKWLDAIEKGRQVSRTSISDQNLPGLSVAVGVGGEIVWTEGFGWANIENHVPVAPHLRFRVGHASNALTSAAVGLLRDRNQLRLDDEIQTYVPTFPKKPWPVTVRQLMGHVAGIKHYSGEEADIPSGHCERASEGLKTFENDPLLFEPGTESRYSTYGWVLVSAAVEGAAGEPFFTFMQSQIFTPLSMGDTRPDSATEPIPNRVTFYFPRFSGDNWFGHDVAATVDYSCFAGAGAFLSTPADLVRFGMAMSSDTLLQPGTIRILQSPQPLASGADTGFGLGWMLETFPIAGEPTRLAGHASRSLLGAAASFMTFPDRGIVVAVMSNTSYGSTRPIAERIANAFAEQAKRPAR